MSRRSYGSRRLAVALLLLSTGAAHATSRDAGPPTSYPELTLDGGTIRVTLAEPGGAAVLFGFAQETRRHVLYLVRREEVLEDLDGDGEVTLELDREIAPTSVWVAVDLATGASGVAAPTGMALREIAISSQGLVRRLDRLDLELAMAEVLLVRPGVGAWGLRVGDGGEDDADGAEDGTARAALTGLYGIGASPPLPPAEISPDDVVVVIDPNTLRLVIVRLAA